ncbi:ribonuclease H-like domain-containing protein, partial [Tanacetum coccineum]
TKDVADSNPNLFDVAKNILMNDQGVGAVSTHNHIVGGLNSNRELSYEAFNTMPSVEVCEVVMDTVYERWQALLKVNDTMTNEASPSKVTPSDLIVQYVDINTKSTSYVGVAGASTKDQPKVKSNFHLLVADLVFDGVNISIPRKVVKKAKNELKRIMMNAKGFFFFKFDTRAGLEANLEGVKLHDVPIQFFEEDGISLIATFISKHVALVDVITIGIPSLTVEGFTKETIRVEYEWRPPSEQTNDSFQIVGKKKMKGKSESTNDLLIMEYLVKISKKARILELKRRHLKITVLISNTPYPSRKIRRICACTSLKTTKDQGSIHQETEEQKRFLQCNGNSLEETTLRNLKIQKMNIKFRGGLLGLKRLHGFLEVTAAQAIRIKQYFQIQDYALWEVIENGDSWVSISQTTEENGITITKMSTPATAEEKTKKKNNVKARGLLLIALLNEHQLTNIQYPDAKSMFAAIETRFRGNAATKKTLLKQQYENFSATSAESLDSIFNRLQKIVSRLAILGVIIAQEDLNLKFLSSLPPEWNTHVVVWMNKPEIETMSIDDLYNNFKIVEQKIKKTVGTSSGGQNLAFMTTPNSSSTNDANTAYSQVNTASPSDLEQIHEDDLEAMDLKRQLSLLSVRAKKYYQKIGKKIFINGNDIAGYDKSKVECYNCHKLGHFARECRASRSKETKKTLPRQYSEVYTDKTCSKTCLNNYETLKKQYDDLLAKQHQTNFKAATYKRGLDTIEAQLVTYRKNEVKKTVGTSSGVKNLAFMTAPSSSSTNNANITSSQVSAASPSVNTDLEAIHKDDLEAMDLKWQLSLLIGTLCQGCRAPRIKVLISRTWQKNSSDQPWLYAFSDSEVYTDKTCSKICLKNYETLKKQYDDLLAKQHQTEFKAITYKRGLDTVEAQLVTYRKNETYQEFKEPEVNKYGPRDSSLKPTTGCDKESDNSKENTDDSLEQHQMTKTETSSFKSPLKVSDDEEQDESKTKPEKKTVIPTAAKIEKPVKKLVRTPVNTVRPRVVNTARSNRTSVNAARANRSKHMTGNIAYLSDFKQFDGGYVSFGGGAYAGKISGKGTLKTANLDFEDVNAENVDNGEPKTADDIKSKDEDGLNNRIVLSYMEPLRKKSMLLNHQDLKILTIQTKFTRWIKATLCDAIKHQEQWDSLFELVAYTDSDYAGATLDRKFITRGCQFLGNRLISWQCKKKTMVATSIIEAEYVVAASCCGQVLWIQNQLLDYRHISILGLKYWNAETLTVRSRNTSLHRIKHELELERRKKELF